VGTRDGQSLDTSGQTVEGGTARGKDAEMRRNSMKTHLPLLGMSLSLLAAMSAPAAAQIPERQIGSVLGVPLQDFGPFIVANVLRGNNVNFLHLSQTAVGDLNTQVVTVGVTQRNNGQPAETLYIPTKGAGQVPAIYRQINVNDTLIQQTAIGVGNTQVAQVEVNQENTGTYVPGATRFLLVPSSGLPALKEANAQTNINEVHLQQTAIGEANTQVALVAVNQANASNLRIPGEALVDAITNINTNVVVQTAVGSGNNQVASVTVNQQNAPAPTAGPG
jgi:hypothetical protein